MHSGQKMDQERLRVKQHQSQNNIYVTWWTNQTVKGDGEVMFKASNDGGATFGDKINLSNNSNTNSVDAEIAASGNDVIVSWWEKNKTTNEPVTRIRYRYNHGDMLNACRAGYL